MILNRPIAIALIVAFTVVVNVHTVFSTINHGIELIILPVFINNLVIPLLLIIGALGVWFYKLWGWWVLVTTTGITVFTGIAYLLKIPLVLYLSYIMTIGLVVIIESIIFYYLFNKNILSAFAIPLEKRTSILKQCLSISVIGGLLMFLVLPGIK